MTTNRTGEGVVIFGATSAVAHSELATTATGLVVIAPVLLLPPAICS